MPLLGAFFFARNKFQTAGDAWRGRNTLQRDAPWGRQCDRRAVNFFLAWGYDMQQASGT